VPIASEVMDEVRGIVATRHSKADHALHVLGHAGHHRPAAEQEQSRYAGIGILVARIRHGSHDLAGRGFKVRCNDPPHLVITSEAMGTAAASIAVALN